ncbi:Mrp/NBP35 ATP-binding protein [Kipferlia bialata]|uniref:Mrp/NBP35 ATP-binding protein n=1 Tax=Kipferlia bialata TaxID=797122 RepID=A0A9K3CSJ4_9EUKA|nr:Mrp/NBP35 ATP-binding protein [Kipferlia bialata]|eukprot:g2876.t1
MSVTDLIPPHVQCAHREVLVILSGKGGVGKSTISAQLGFCLASVYSARVGLLDLDICGPSLPTLTGTKGKEVRNNNHGWTPVPVADNLSVMSIGFLLNGDDDAVIWRGPRKTALIQQFLTEVQWGPLDYLIIDTPPGTSDEHLSVLSMLLPALAHKTPRAIVVATPQAMAEAMGNVPFLGRIPLDPVLVTASENGMSWAEAGSGVTGSMTRSTAEPSQDDGVGSAVTEQGAPGPQTSEGLTLFSEFVEKTLTLLLGVIPPRTTR